MYTSVDGQKTRHIYSVWLPRVSLLQQSRDLHEDIFGICENLNLIIV